MQMFCFTAICDALLGAAALGDIENISRYQGAYRNISSLKLLKQVGIMIHKSGYDINNIDSTLVLEKPKIAKYVDLMCQRIGKHSKIPHQLISIKATTHEGLGILGQGEGCAAFAIASYCKKKISELWNNLSITL